MKGYGSRQLERRLEGRLGRAVKDGFPSWAVRHIEESLGRAKHKVANAPNKDILAMVQAWHINSLLDAIGLVDSWELKRAID